jgi:predicted amidohydrolase
MSRGVLRIALAQCTAVPGDVSANVDAAARTVAAAREKGAELVVFPELSLSGYDLDRIAATPEAWFRADDARLDAVRRVCSDAGVTAVVGAPFRTADDRPRISAFIVRPEGRLEVSHKQYVHRSEAHLFEKGDPVEPFDVAGWRVAVAICFDVANPRHAETAAARGADLYAVSALYAVGEERRADLHHGARAMDHRMFACLANYAGTIGGHVSCGLSGVWTPSGEVALRAASTGAELLFAILDRAALDAFR